VTPPVVTRDAGTRDAVDQRSFVAALLDADRPAPEGLAGPTGAPAGKRFDVYRNNVAVSLTEALRSAFPVLRTLLGDAFFDAMAGIYLRRHPPASPLMMHYGADMPEFLAGFPPVAAMPYLPDVARLELALREAYHAEDAAPADPGRLAELGPDALFAARVRFAPAVRIVASRYPVHGIWHARGAPDRDRAETALVTRPDFDPVVDPLTPDQGVLIAALIDGTPLGAAAGAAPGADAGATLALLLTRQALTEIG